MEHAARPKQATLSLVISLSSADVERSTVWTKLGMSPSEARVDPTAPQVRVRLASSTPFVEFIALSHPTTPLDPEGLPNLGLAQAESEQCLIESTPHELEAPLSLSMWAESSGRPKTRGLPFLDQPQPLTPAPCRWTGPGRPGLLLRHPARRLAEPPTVRRLGQVRSAR